MKFLSQLQQWPLAVPGLLAAATLAVWLAGDALTLRLAGLPVHSVAGQHRTAAPADLRTLFPVWVRGSAAPAARADDGIDAVLRPAAPAIPAPGPADGASVAPDYPALLASRLVLDGVSADGAFLNGKFYRVGAPIADFEYPLGGRQIVPVLSRVGPRSVLVLHGPHRLELRL